MIGKPSPSMPCGKVPCDSSCTLEKCASNPNCKYKNGTKAMKQKSAKSSYAEMKAAINAHCASCGKCNDK